MVTLDNYSDYNVTSMDPKKDDEEDEDKQKKNSDKEGFEGFDGEPKYQYGFFGLLTGLILSYLYENMGFDLGEQSTMNAFLNVSYSPKMDQLDNTMFRMYQEVVYRV